MERPERFGTVELVVPCSSLLVTEFEDMSLARHASNSKRHVLHLCDGMVKAISREEEFGTSIVVPCHMTRFSATRRGVGNDVTNQVGTRTRLV